MGREIEIDAMGLLCPLPVLRVQRRMRQLEPGDTIRLIADDPAAIVDVPHYCDEQGHELVRHDEDADRNVFVIRKSS